MSRPTLPQPSRRAILAAPAVLVLGALPSGAAERRIVAAGGVITEILYALGRQDLLVGVDSTSLFPAEAMREKASVGYVRALSAEGVLSLRPTDLLAVEGAGPPDTVKLIAEAGVRVERISEDTSEAGVAARIRAIGRFADAADRAEALAGKVEAGFAALKQQRDALAARKRVLFVLSLQNGRVMVGGARSSADAIIRLAGAVNAADTVEGYKPLTDEGLIAAAPDVVLMMKHNEHAASPEQVFGQPALSATPAARTRSLVAMDGLYLLGFGPRTPDAARDLMAAVYAGPRP
ncbi:MAG: heme/hemin ABC transporter substrate-binding protein [Phreatobacter sp.]|jgi:iron complex transport system substrate-binding protein|uniref:heme/hemin ABC transporter substrate-binding protein n=1 Tax=Phreatobacter sp. TaxID=1966341 RepID=UPI004035B3D1